MFREMRVLVDLSGAIAVGDPSGAAFKFVMYDIDKKRIRSELDYPFCGYTDYRNELREELTEMLSAVERPWLKKEVKAEIVEIK